MCLGQFYIILSELHDFLKVYINWKQEEITSQEAITAIILAMRTVSRQMPKEYQCSELLSSNVFALHGEDYRKLEENISEYLEGLRTYALK